MNNLREYRRMAKLTQEELAERVGCRRETIGKLEAGKYNPSLGMAYRIISILNANMGGTRYGGDLDVTEVFPPESYLAVK